VSSWGFIVRRLAWSFVALIGLSLVIFILSRVIPGDPARMALGPGAPESAVNELRQQMRLNQPLYAQYAGWL